MSIHMFFIIALSSRSSHRWTKAPSTNHEKYRSPKATINIYRMSRRINVLFVIHIYNRTHTVTYLNKRSQLRAKKKKHVKEREREREKQMIRNELSRKEGKARRARETKSCHGDHQRRRSDTKG